MTANPAATPTTGSSRAADVDALVGMVYRIDAEHRPASVSVVNDSVTCVCGTESTDRLGLARHRAELAVAAILAATGDPAASPTDVTDPHLAQKLAWLAANVHVPDGGQYRNDWPAAVERLVRERDEARTALSTALTTLRTLAARWKGALTWENKPALVERGFGDALESALEQVSDPNPARVRIETDAAYQRSHDRVVTELMAEAARRRYLYGPGNEVQKAALHRAEVALGAIQYKPANLDAAPATAAEHTGCGNGECCQVCTGQNLPYPFQCVGEDRTGTCEHTD